MKIGRLTRVRPRSGAVRRLVAAASSLALLGLCLGVAHSYPAAGRAVGADGEAPQCGSRRGGRNRAEHLLLQPRRPARRVPRRRRPAAVHAQDARLAGRRAPVHADVRGRSLVLPVPRCPDDRPLPAQQRRPRPAGRATVRRTALDGLLPAQRRLRHLPGRQVPHHLAQDEAASVLHGLDRDVGRVLERGGEGERGLPDGARATPRRTSATAGGSTSPRPCPERLRSSSTRRRRPRTGSTSPTPTAPRRSWRCPTRRTPTPAWAPAPACPRPIVPTSPPTCAA